MLYFLFTDMKCIFLIVSGLSIFYYKEIMLPSHPNKTMTLKYWLSMKIIKWSIQINTGQMPIMHQSFCIFCFYFGDGYTSIYIYIYTTRRSNILPKFNKYYFVKNHLCDNYESLLIINKIHHTYFVVYLVLRR
jgi:hypothetical protein